MAILAQIVLYRVILSMFLRLKGTWPDVGSNFMGFWLFAVVPCAALLVLLASLGHRWIETRHPRYRGPWLAGIWVANVVLMFVSLVYYASHLHE